MSIWQARTRSSEAVKAGTTTRVLEIYPGRAIAGYRFSRNNHLAGWGLRCGDDGSKWSRGTSPSPPKPCLLAHPDPVSRPGFLICSPIASFGTRPRRNIGAHSFAR